MAENLGRLTKKKDFDQVFKIGASSYDKITGIKLAENSLKINRFGIIVSSKVSKLAVDRNKIKRRIREILMNNKKNLNFYYDMVVLALPKSKNSQYQDFEKSILAHFKKFGLY